MKLLYCVEIEGNKCEEGYFEDGRRYKFETMHKANRAFKRLKKVKTFKDFDGFPVNVENIRFSIQAAQ